MSDKPLVSVIIPVYNGAKHLDRTLDCLFNQTYPSIEIITINDGSKDESLEILKQRQMSLPVNTSMHVLNQQNKGICYTRNRGIEEANGKYIMFMDQDDTVKPDIIEKLVELMESDSENGIAICGYDLKSPEGKILDVWKLDPSEIYSPYRNPAPWGRIYRKDIIDANRIRFMDIKISEDFYFNFVYMSYCKRLAVTEYIGYAWYLYPGSESHANMSVLSEDRNPLVMLTKLHEDMHKPNVYDKDCFEYMVTKHIFWYLLYTAKGADLTDLKNARKECMRWLLEYYPNYKKNPYVKAFGKKLAGESSRINKIVRIAVGLEKMHLFGAFLTGYSKFL